MELQRCQRQLLELTSADQAGHAAARPPRTRCRAASDVALRVFVLAKFDEAAALQYIATNIKCRALSPSLSPGELRLAYDALSQPEQASLLNDTTEPSQRWLQQAKKFLAERSLQDWLRIQNQAKALAPSGVHVYLQWQQACQDPPAMKNVGGQQPKHGARVRRQWVRRWSRRWGLLRGAFQVGSKVPLPLAQEKASVRNIQHTQSNKTFLDQRVPKMRSRLEKSRAQNAARFRASNLFRHLSWQAARRPNSGPPYVPAFWIFCLKKPWVFEGSRVLAVGKLLGVSTAATQTCGAYQHGRNVHEDVAATSKRISAAAARSSKTALPGRGGES